MTKRLNGFFNKMFYRLLMKIAHKYHWHYAPPIYPNGDVQLWCKWCGFRQTVKRGELNKDIEFFEKKLLKKILIPKRLLNGKIKSGREIDINGKTT